MRRVAITLLHAVLPAALFSQAASEPAAAQQRPAVIVTPGSEQTYRAAVQRFADGSPAASPGRAAAFQRSLGEALELSGAPLTNPRGQGVPARPVHDGQAYWIKVSAQADGSFSVLNGRNGFTKVYRR